MISSVDRRDFVECKACLLHRANKETEARKERNSSESQGESGLAFLIPGPRRICQMLELWRRRLWSVGALGHSTSLGSWWLFPYAGGRGTSSAWFQWVIPLACSCGQPWFSVLGHKTERTRREPIGNESHQNALCPGGRLSEDTLHLK